MKRIALALLPALALACGGSTSDNGNDGTPAVPGAVAGFMAMEMGAGAHLSWQDTFTNETGFEIQRKQGTGEFAKLVDVPANTSEYMDDDVPKDVQLTYRARAINAAGAGAWSAEASFTLPSTNTSGLAAPMNLHVASMGGAFHVSWTNMAEGPTGFELQRKSGADDFATVKTTSGSTTSWMDMSVQAGTTYTYRVRALKNADMSDWSDEATGTP